MADSKFVRPPGSTTGVTGQTWSAARYHRRRRFGAGTAVAAAVAIVLVAVVAFGVVVATAHPSVTTDPAALARINLPFGGGQVERLTVVGGREQKLLPTSLRNDRVWPTQLLGTHERVTVEVTVRRPGWISWLTGSTERVRLTLWTPSTRLRSHYLTVRSGAPLRLSFQQPVSVLEYGAIGAALSRHVLSTPVSSFSLPAPSAAGTITVAAAPRSWEAPQTDSVSWFPPGSNATVVASPAPGTAIGPDTRISFTFSKPVAQALGTHLPPVSPNAQGSWQQVGAHTIVFQPQGYGYGLGTSVTIPLPAGIRLVGGQSHGSDPIGQWSVPGGSTLRLQQLLAQLGYLPVNFTQTGTPVASTLSAQMAAAIHPPAGSFNWRYPNTPSPIRSDWAPGQSGVMTRGAIMAFENDHGMTADGVPGPAVWKALINAAMSGQHSSFGYTFVMVSESLPQSIDVWHNGQTVVTGPVNTGIAAAPTATGIYPVFEHLTVTTMSGTNPDGSHYSDPGIPWVSYFNGGDALHGFIRASYGYPQSLGCVEMPFSEAGKVYPFTPIGTLVDVS